MASCLVCHRGLRKEPSLSRGVGPSCAKKIRGMAGMAGTGGKSFRVLGDEYWEHFILSWRGGNLGLQAGEEAAPSPPSKLFCSPPSLSAS